MKWAVFKAAGSTVCISAEFGIVVKSNTPFHLSEHPAAAISVGLNLWPAGYTTFPIRRDNAELR